MLQIVWLESKIEGVKFDGSKLETKLGFPLKAEINSFVRVVESNIGPVSNLEPTEQLLYFKSNILFLNLKEYQISLT